MSTPFTSIILNSSSSPSNIYYESDGGNNIYVWDSTNSVNIQRIDLGVSFARPSNPISIPQFGQFSYDIGLTSNCPPVVVQGVLYTVETSDPKRIQVWSPYIPNILGFTTFPHSFYTITTNISYLVGGGNYLFAIDTSGTIWRQTTNFTSMQNIPGPTGTAIGYAASGNFLYCAIQGSGTNPDVVYHMDASSSSPPSWTSLPTVSSTFKIGQVIGVSGHDSTKYNVAVIDTNTTNQQLYLYNQSSNNWTQLTFSTTSGTPLSYASSQIGLCCQSTVNGPQIYSNSTWNAVANPPSSPTTNITGTRVFGSANASFPVIQSSLGVGCVIENSP